MAATRIYLQHVLDDFVEERGSTYPVVRDWDGQEYTSIAAVTGDSRLICLEMLQRDGTGAEVPVVLTAPTSASCIIRSAKSSANTSVIYGYQDLYNQQSEAAIEDLPNGKINWLFNIGYLRYTITAVDTGTKTFTIANNYASQFTDDDTFTIAGSTGNDGAYTINGTPTYDAGSNTTLIVVDQVIADATADGEITHNALQQATYTNGKLTAYIECSWIDAAGNEQTLLPIYPITILAQLEDAVVGIDAGLAPNYLTEAEVAAAYVANTLFDAFSILAADTDDTPAALTVPAQSLMVRAAAGIVALTMGEGTVLGRLAGGNLSALTAANLKTLLALTAADVSALPLAGGTMSGDIDMDTAAKLLNLLGLNMPAATELTIATGVVTATQMLHAIDTEADAASDTLGEIQGATGLLFTYQAAAARVVTLSHGTSANQITTPTAGNLTLSPYGLTVLYRATTSDPWRVLAGGVSSVFGRTGAVVATAGDYDDTEIDALGSATNYTVSTPTVRAHLLGIDTALGLLAASGVPATAVTDIDDPSTELNAITPTANGELRIAYQVDAAINSYTLYVADSANSGSESVPYTVDAGGGSYTWVAIAGRYNYHLQEVGQSEAEAGTATTARAWTAQRVAQAIAALASTDSRWTTISSGYTAAPTDTNTLAMSDTTAVDGRVGCPVRYTIGGTVYYGIIASIVANTSMDIVGDSLSGSVTLLEIGVPELVVLYPLPTVSGPYGDATSTDLMADKLYRNPLIWDGPPVRILGYYYEHRVDDGTSQPRINVEIGGTNVSSANTSAGVDPSTTRADTGVLINTPLQLDKGDTIELEVNTAGGAGDALDLDVTLFGCLLN